MARNSADKDGAVSKKRSEKEQISLEYMMIFAFAFLVVAVVVAYLYVTGVRNTTYTNAYCYLTPDMPCQGMYVVGNSASPANAMAYVIFTNDKGTGIYVKPGAFHFYPSTGTAAYQGDCIPANIPEGGVAVCNAAVVNVNGGLSSGEQLNPKFNIAYSVCNNNYCSGLSANAPVFSTAGTGTTYVASGAPSLYYVTIGSNSINVTVDGAYYAHGSKLAVFKGVKYSLFGDAPAGYDFGTWTSTGGVLVASLTQSTSFMATSNGTVSGSYVAPPPPPTTSALVGIGIIPTLSTSTSTSISSTTSTSTSTSSTTTSTSTSTTSI